MSRRWTVLLVSCTGAFLAFLDATIVNIAFPDIRRSFPGASLSGLSWVLSAYNIVFAALLVPGGRLADAIGRRRVFVGGLLLFTLASAACAAAQSPEQLVAARVLQAVGGAALIPTSIAFLLAEFPIGMRATAMSLWGAAAAVAAAAGPSLGGLLIEWSSWRAIFAVNLPVGVLAAVYGMRLLSESRREEGEPLPDLAGVVLVTGAIGLLALAIVQGPTWGWGDWRIVSSFAGAAVLTPLTVLRSLAHPSPVLEVALFRIRSLAVANAGTLVFSAAFYAMILCHVLFLTQVWGYSVLDAGLALSPAPLCAAIAAAPAGRIADRAGQRVLAVPGTILFACGNAWFVYEVGTQPAFASEWLPGAVLTGTGVGITVAALGSAAVAEVPSESFGLGSAISSMSRQIGAVLGVAILVAIVGTPSPAGAPAAFDHGWRFASLSAIGAALISLGLGRGPAGATREDLAVAGPATAALGGEGS
ncbi:MAG TPA: DHA2 family efflux MFS transporter permease subunit [Thermoleophilaceae bacterium]|jgi:EmrB/QacA subfamily drug resistance transporter